MPIYTLYGCIFGGVKNESNMESNGMYFYGGYINGTNIIDEK